MALVKDIHDAVRLISNQGQGRYLNPEEIDIAMNQASYALFEELRKEWEKTRLYDDKLSPFKKVTDFRMESGRVDLPATVSYSIQMFIKTAYTVTADTIGDLFNVIGVANPFQDGDRVRFIFSTAPSPVATNTDYFVVNRTSNTFQISASLGGTPVTITSVGADIRAYGATVDGVEIDMVRDGEWPNRVNDLVCPPDSDYPIGRIFDGKIEVRPTSIEVVSLYNMEYPVTGVFGYTTSGDGRTPIYDGGSTTEMGWLNNARLDILMRTLRILKIPYNQNQIDKIDNLKLLKDANN